MKKQKQRGEVDKIGNLPGHIVDEILSRLPIRDAVRTSILSRNWRYKWVTLPYLLFDEESLLLYSQDYKTNTHRNKRVVSIVDCVLLHHIGPIDTFKLSHPDFEGVGDIDRWILYLSRNSVEYFILELCEGAMYKVPSSIYSFQKLKHLVLCDCDLRPPLEFNGFKCLRSLTIVSVTIEQLGFEQMISRCPLLESLSLHWVAGDGLSLLNIHAPNLRYLHFENQDFIDFNLQNTSNLADVTIDFHDYNGIVSKRSSNSLIHFFTCLPHIRQLFAHCRFFTHLSEGTIPKKLATACLDLTSLSIDINFNDTKEILAALCLLRSSPNLQKLQLHALSEGEATATTEDNIEEIFETFPLNQLRRIQIYGRLTQELRFIKLLLENAPLLERMIVKPQSVYSERDLLTELLCFQRASTAQIIYRGCGPIYRDP